MLLMIEITSALLSCFQSLEFDLSDRVQSKSGKRGLMGKVFFFFYFIHSTFILTQVNGPARKVKSSIILDMSALYPVLLRG